MKHFCDVFQKLFPEYNTLKTSCKICASKINQGHTAVFVAFASLKILKKILFDIIVFWLTRPKRKLKVQIFPRKSSSFDFFVKIWWSNFATVAQLPFTSTISQGPTDLLSPSQYPVEFLWFLNLKIVKLEKNKKGAIRSSKMKVNFLLKYCKSVLETW